MDNSVEVWKTIEGFKGHYQISSFGQVKSCKPGRPVCIIKQRVDRAGYYAVTLSIGGVAETHLVHRLVGLAFIENVSYKCCINHKNGCKTDNRLDNLEWVTQSENTLHAYRTGIIDKGRRCTDVIDICSGRSYKSIKEASLKLTINYSTCRNMLNGYVKNTTCLRKRSKRVKDVTSLKFLLSVCSFPLKPLDRLPLHIDE